MKVFSLALAAAVAGLVVGCTTEATGPQGADGAPPPAAATQIVAHELAVQALAPGLFMPKSQPDGRPLLTPMDFALVLIDPADLTVPQRRKRAQAHRKLILNNPDSPAARTLNDLAQAHRDGDLEVPSPDRGVVLHPKGAKPTGGRPPAGSRPASAQPDVAPPEAG